MSTKADPIDLDAAARLTLVRKSLNLGQQEIADICKVSKGWISHMETGRRAIPFEVLKFLCLDKRINPAYVLTGEAPMVLGKAKKDNYLDLAAEVEVLKAELKRFVSGNS